MYSQKSGIICNSEIVEKRMKGICIVSLSVAIDDLNEKASIVH